MADSDSDFVLTPVEHNPFDQGHLDLTRMMFPGAAAKWPGWDPATCRYAAQQAPREAVSSVEDEEDGVLPQPTATKIETTTILDLMVHPLCKL